jgi:hypothetical protein
LIVKGWQTTLNQRVVGSSPTAPTNILQILNGNFKPASAG